MNNKSSIITSLTVSLLLMMQSAHADFRAALDALQRKDGTVMMTEVRSAVNTKNDVGLLLFLNGLCIDDVTSKKETLYENFDIKSSSIKSKSDSGKIKSSFESILTSDQQHELLVLLDKATSNSTLESQYKLFSMRDFNIKLLPALNEWRRIGNYSDLTKSGKEKYVVATSEWRKESAKALESIANKGNADAAFELFLEYNTKGVLPPQYSHERAAKWLIKSAELGSPIAASILGYKYLHIKSDYAISHESCDERDTDAVCFDKDEKRGEYWLKEAAKRFDENPTYFGMPILAYEIGRYFEYKGKAYSNNLLLKQAYLWYQLALNSPQDHRLGGLRLKEKLKYAIEPYRLSIDENLRTLVQTQHKVELPDWIVNTRKSLDKDTPVFSLLRRDYIHYQLSVYADGNVHLEFPIGVHSNMTRDKDSYMHVSPALAKEFINKLHEIGVDEWPINRGPFDEHECMDDRQACDAKDYLVMLNTNSNRRLLLIGVSDFYSRGADGVVTKFISRHEEKKLKNINQLLALVEMYFPTQKLRCSLGNSRLFEQACIKNDTSQFSAVNLGE